MLCIFNNNTDIYFNLAAEEFLLKSRSDDIIMLWQSTPCIVVGKHQNAFAEINSGFVSKNNIPVARRLSGGGTVYHDSGNINFTFIANGSAGKLVDFKKFVTPVIEFLSTLGIIALIGEKNDLLINGLKISGNAEHIHRKRVLHHGTLLFNSDLEKLRESLKIVPGRYIDKAIQSNRATVANISNYLAEKITVDEFASRLFIFLSGKYNHSIHFEFIDNDNAAISKLRDEKYASWDWIYGYSPAFSLIRTISINNKKYSFKIDIEKGIITKAEFLDYMSDLTFKNFMINMVGRKFNYNEIKGLIFNSGINENIRQNLIELLF
jgi:lipoate---protein ligase